MPQTPSSARVLIVDDDDMSRELLAALLEEDGVTVQSADSGAAALELLRSNSFEPSVVLTDMQMPGMTPEALASLLRAACSPQTILLAMSGSVPALAVQAQFDGFLLKPFSVEDFNAAVTFAAHAPAAQKEARGPRLTAVSTAQSGVVDLAASGGAAASKKKMGAVDTSAIASARVPPPVRKSPILNEEIYMQLAGAMPRAQLHEMYSMCLTDARKRIASMKSSAAAADNTQFVRQAHAIKGSSGMLGATEVHQMASALENCGLDTPQSSVNSLDELTAACDRLERMLGARA